MRRLVLTAMVLVAQLAAASARAGGCSEPAAFTDVPAGASATREQMLSAQRAIKAYDLAVKAYSDCLHDSGDTSIRANQAVERLERIAERFNVELKVFKEHHGAT
jgi:hypothetical protein